MELFRSKNLGTLGRRAGWGGGSRVGIRSSVLEKLSLKCLLNMQVEMPSRQLEV